MMAWVDEIGQFVKWPLMPNTRMRFSSVLLLRKKNNNIKLSNSVGFLVPQGGSAQRSNPFLLNICTYIWILIVYVDTFNNKVINNLLFR